MRGSGPADLRQILCRRGVALSVRAIRSSRTRTEPSRPELGPYLAVGRKPASLLTGVLRDVGFSEVAEAAFARGTCPEIVKDSEWRAWESVYVEARKQVPSGTV